MSRGHASVSGRVIEYPARGFAVAQSVPAEVLAACRRLIAAGYESRLLKE